MTEKTWVSGIKATNC